MKYYDLDQTLEIFKEKLSKVSLPFDSIQLIDLCKYGELTPVFYYDLCLDSIVIGNYGNQVVNPYTFKGYLTSDVLKELVYSYFDSMNCTTNQLSEKIYDAYIYETFEARYSWDIDSGHEKIFAKDSKVLLFQHQQKFNDLSEKTAADQKEYDAFTVTPNMIRFSHNEILISLSSFLRLETHQNELHKQEIECLGKTIATLEKECETLKEELENLRKQLISKDTLLDNSVKEDTKQSYLTTIGLLLQLITNPKWQDKKTKGKSEAQIISLILEYNLYGQRKTTLENRFRDAKKHLQQAEKA